MTSANFTLSTARLLVLGVGVTALLALSPAISLAASDHDHKHSHEREHLSLANHEFEWPTWEQFVDVISMQKYNTRTVLLGTTFLGICAGTVGTFMLLRKRSLIGDVVSHASLPGIAIAFLVMELFDPGSGKSLSGLLIGALIAGLLGVLCTVAIRRLTRIKEDAAMAIVLSIFFGLGIALFTVVQNIPSGNVAGLHHFIFGKTASMIAADVTLIVKAAVIVLLVCCLLFKEFSLMCFDEEFATTQGWPVLGLDLMLMGLVVGVSIIGLQSVGLLLVVAMLIIPAASARFWTDKLGKLTIVAAGFGGLSAFMGVLLSALFPRIAAGAVIVLSGSFLFIISMALGTRRGIIGRIRQQRRTRQRVGRHDLLRAVYEFLEPSLVDDVANLSKALTKHPVQFEQLLGMRSWSTARLRKLIRTAKRGDILRAGSNESLHLTEVGAIQSQNVVRNHRLWEIYLIEHADIAPSHVDRDADIIEHLLGPELMMELDGLLSQRYPNMAVPSSPHPIGHMSA